MKRILVLSEIYWSEGGGAELATHLILNLLKDDYNITVITGTKQPDRLDGLKYVYSELLNTSNKIHLWRNLMILNNMSWFINLVKQVTIVYIPRIAYPVIPLAEKYGKKVIVHLHNYQPLRYHSIVFPYSARKQNLFNQIRSSVEYELLENESVPRALGSSIATPFNELSRILVRHADNIICVSKRQAEIVLSEMPELASKTKIVYNPLPEIPFLIKKVKEPTFLYIGGSSFIKGIHILAKASTKLLKHVKAKFILAKIGKGAWKSAFEKIEQAFSDSYLIYQRLQHKELQNLYTYSTALIMPSICEEPFPSAIVESMLTGTMPIASRIGGIPEIVQRTFAEKLLFTTGDIDELVHRMEFVLSLSNEQLLDIGLSLRQEVSKKFDNKALEERYSEIFG